MKSCFCTIGRKTEPLQAALDVAQRCGFDGVELWGNPPHVPGTFDSDCVATIRGEILSRQLEPLALGSYVGSLRDGLEAEISRGQDAIRTAEALGVPIMRVWAGHASPDTASRELWSAATRLFKTLAAAATDKGLLLAVERHEGTLSETVDGIFRLVESVDHPAFRVNYQMRYLKQEDAAAEVQRLGSLVVHVHTHNLTCPQDAAGDVRQVALREGYVDWSNMVKTLNEIGFGGAICVEYARTPPPEQQLREDAAFLKELIERHTK